MAQMQAARLHEVGAPFQVDQIDAPVPGPHDVIVKVEAANVVPNLRNVINHYPEWFPFLPLPPLPAIYGLDAAGVVTEVGSGVRNVTLGQRVYVNPGRYTPDSHASRSGEPINDPAYTFQGYFGFGPGSKDVFEEYPHGGFSELMKTPANSLVFLPDEVTFEQACRFGYLGTAYSGLRKGGVTSGTSVLIHGGTGTLGVGGVLNALAMGATKVLVVARNKELLERVRQLDEKRVFTLSYGEADHGEWVRGHTHGLGADVFLDAIGPEAPVDPTLDGIDALRRGGRMVTVGGMSERLPVEMFRLMCFQISIIGSLWFSVKEGEDMAEMAAAGTLNLSVFDHERFPLDKVNEALDAIEKRAGGFTNILVTPGK